MNTNFLEYFKQFTFLSFDDIKMVYSSVKIKKAARDELLVKEGEMFCHAIYIIKGLLRTYVNLKNGDERTVALAHEGMQAGCPECLFRGNPSTENIQSLENSTLVYLDIKTLDKISKSKPGLLRLKNKNMENALLQIFDRVRFLTDLTHEERYVYMRDKQPNLVQRVPQKYLASYLGVTPESLSRIKARIAENQG